MNEDFSLKWFGVPDATIFKFWEQLESIKPKYPSHHYEGWCNCYNCHLERRERIYDLQRRGFLSRT